MNKMKQLDADQRIQKQIISLLRVDPLYADYLLRWPRLKMATGTMCVNGKVLKYCPTFVDSLTDGRLRVVLKHEVMHVMFKHTLRASGYHAAEMMKSDRITDAEVHDLMNRAGDLEINDLLRQNTDDRANFPPEGLTTDAPEYADHPKSECMEVHYDLLRAKSKPPEPDSPDGDEEEDSPEDTPKNAAEGDSDGSGDGDGESDGEAGENDSTGDSDGSEGQGDGQGGDAGDGFGGMGEFNPDPEATNKEEAQRLSQEYDQQLISAVMAAQSQGKVPGWAKEMVDEITAPAKVPWQVLLRRWARKCVRGGESTFSRPSRRSMYRTDLVLPSKRTNSIRRVMVIADTSGSMATGAVNAVMPECLKIMQSWKQAELILIQCDAAVADEATYKARSGFKDLKAFAKSPCWKGRGGTDMTPALKLVTKYKPEVIICLTDGYLSWPDKSVANGIPTMWLMVTDVVPPWGQSIRM